jgi:hypothetical protein
VSEAFEEVVAVLLEADGYWVKRNVKLHVPGATALGLKSGACELDIVAYRHSHPAEVLVVECKSFGRSGGVDKKTFDPPVPPIARRHRYKLFWSPQLRQGISQLLGDTGVTPQGVQHVYCLASAATAKADHQYIANYLTSNGMRFFDRAWLSKNLAALASSSVYQNCIVSTLASFYHGPSNGNYA